MRKSSTSKKTQIAPTSAAQIAASTNAINNVYEKPGMQQEFWILKSSTAPKIGKQSEGVIGYKILSDMERTCLHIVITSNEGGGYFSREIVPFNKIHACLKSRVQDKPFPSKLFKDAFIGRSSNNAGFLAAILRVLGLLATAPDAETQHVVGDDWEVWQKLMLAEKGEKIDMEIKQPDTKEEESSPEPGPMKSTKTLTLPHPETDTCAE